MVDTSSRQHEADGDASDFCWGAAAIGREINRTAVQVYHLYESGALEGCAVKLGHRTLLGSRKKLRALVSGKKS
jgi:hypothetical protein